MKNKILFFVSCILIICTLCFSGCDNNFEISIDSNRSSDSSNDIGSDDEFKKVTTLGDIPNEFNEIVNNNVFKNVSATGDKLIEYYYDYATSIYIIKLLDKSGKILTKYERELPYALKISSIASTSNGGYIVAFGFSDYAISNDNWASDSGVYSLILKFDANGNLEWETRLDNYKYHMLDFCFERDSGYYFFGSQETPETDIRGIVSPQDVHIALLDKSGNLIKSIAYEGSDYDWIHYVEEKDNNFVIYGDSQSANGIFASLENKTGYPVDFKLIIDANFQIISINKINYNDIPSKEFIGTIGNKKIYTDNEIITGYDAGTVKLIVDYNDFYLIVSENKIGIDNSFPMLNSTKYFTETVYSAYDKNDALIWRATIEN